MSSTKTINKKHRLSFIVNHDLSKKITSISRETKMTVSDITRKALENFIIQYEKEKLNLELEAGYKANYKYYTNTNKDWENADRE